MTARRWHVDVWGRGCSISTTVPAYDVAGAELAGRERFAEVYPSAVVLAVQVDPRPLGHAATHPFEVLV